MPDSDPDTSEETEQVVQPGYTNMMDPPIEELVKRTGSKYLLVTLAAQRAKDINQYNKGLGSSIGGVAPPQISGDFVSPLSIAFEEIKDGKAIVSRTPPVVKESPILPEEPTAKKEEDDKSKD